MWYSGKTYVSLLFLDTVDLRVDYFKSRERLVDPGGFFGVNVVLGVDLSGSRTLNPTIALDTDLYDVKLYLSTDVTIGVDDFEVNRK